MAYGLDRWLYPIVIDSTNNGIDFQEWDGASYQNLSTSISAGTYYAHKDATLTSAGYPSIYQAIQDAMDDAASSSGVGNTYLIGLGTPSSSTLQTLGGILIDSTDDMKWSTIGTINKTGVMGWLYNSGLSAGGSNVYSPYTARGMWVTPLEAASKIAFTQKLITWSTEHTERTDFYALARGDRSRRRIVYDYIPAAHVQLTRANALDYAQSGDLAQYDVYNAFEDVWQQLALGRSVIVVHYAPGATPSTTIVGAGYEVVRLDSSESAGDFGAVADMMLTAGELYRLTVPCVIVDAGDYSGQ